MGDDYDYPDWDWELELELELDQTPTRPNPSQPSPEASSQPPASPMLNIDGRFYTPRVFGTRSHARQTVAERLCAIIGRNAIQAELISLRMGLFKNTLPAMTRSEKRTRQSNLETFSRFRTEVLALLDTPAAINEVVTVALENCKTETERNAVKMHVFGIH
jgi:hypothetical protein